MNAFERLEEVLPVVTIATENGNVRINASDYNPEIHTLADDEAPAPTPQEPPATVAQEPVTSQVSEGDNGQQQTPATVTRVAKKIGAKWFVVDKDGNKIAAEGIDANGYTTEADAWSAAMPSIA